MTSVLESINGDNRIQLPYIRKNEEAIIVTCRNQNASLENDVYWGNLK